MVTTPDVAVKACEILTGPLKTPCGNPTTRQYTAICQNEHVRIKWACEECVHHPNLSCSACVKNGVAASVIITLVEVGNGKDSTEADSAT